MREYHKTAAGFVFLEPMGAGKWNVRKKLGEVLLGTIELEGDGGTYSATVVGRKPQSCPNLQSAIAVVGANG